MLATRNVFNPTALPLAKRERDLLTNINDIFDVLRTSTNLLEPIAGTWPLNRDLDRLLQPVLTDWNPLTDVRETDNNILVHVELPGMKLMLFCSFVIVKILLFSLYIVSVLFISSFFKHLFGILTSLY